MQRPGQTDQDDGRTDKRPAPNCGGLWCLESALEQDQLVLSFDVGVVK